MAATGGATDAIVVSHNHTATSTSAVTDPGHAHNYTYRATTYAVTGSTINAWEGTSTQPTSTATTGVTVGTTTTVASAGVSGTNANLPPYYALAYVMKA